MREQGGNNMTRRAHSHARTLVRSGLIALLVALTLIARGTVASPAHAQTVDVVIDHAINEFPRGVSFELGFTAAQPAKEVRVRYHLAPDGTGASAIATCNDATTTHTCRYTLTSGAGIFIIPGAEITFGWDVTGADGTKTTVGDKLYVHEDTRFTFARLDSGVAGAPGNITLYYHSGGETQARAVLNAAAETIAKVGALEKTEVTFPVKVFLYTTADEMQPAIAPGGQGRGVQVLGEVVYSDTAMVSADVATLDIVRHEVAHIVTRQATKGPFDIAAWLNEGISVFTQTKPLTGQESSLQNAINSDRVLSIKELNSSATGSVGATVGLYYGQAGSIVKFLVDTYGPDKFAELLKTFKDGSTADKAFQSVYNFDQLGLENAWRASVGLKPRPPSASSTPVDTQEARAAATSAAKPTPAAANAASGSSGGVSAVTITIIAVLAVLLLVTIGGAATVIRRRM